MAVPKKNGGEDKAALPMQVDAVSAEVLEAAKAHAGAGVSTDQSDNIVPMIYILQPLSPQVDESRSEYIPGAKAGSVWLRNFSRPIVPGETGLLFQPCFFSKDWPEWIPRERGGGFVARHGTRLATEEDVDRLGVDLAVGEDVPDVDDAYFIIDATNRQKVWRRKGNNNDLVLTRSHAGYVVLDETTVLPYVIPMKGASHKISRGWMFSMMSKMIPGGGGIYPSWTFLYRLTTRRFTNARGSWYALDVAEARGVDKVEFKRGLELHQAFASGEKRAEAEVVAASDDAGAGEVAARAAGKHQPMGDEIPF